MSPKVSVVMSNFNGESLNLLQTSLPSILKNKYNNLEILFVDNKSTDESVKFVKKKFGTNPQLKLIQNPVNMYSQGLNLGIKKSTGKYIVFFNNDATVENGFFEELVKFMEKDKTVAFAQGKLLSSKNSKIIDCAGEVMDLYGNPLSIGNGKKEEGNFDDITELLSVTGSCNILRKDVIEKIGYFDEDYGIGYEDMDLSMRAWERGYKIMYNPKAKVFHQRGATDLSPIIRNKVRFHFNKNRIVTILKHYPAAKMVQALLGVMVIYIGMGFYEMVLEDKWKLGFTRISSVGWVIINLPKILAKRQEIQRKLKKKNQEKMFSLFLNRSFFQSILLVIKK